MNAATPIPTNISVVPLSVSAEQQAVVDAILAGHNAVVDAVAGSGKSTTVLSLAQAMPNKKFLQITYNSMLRKEFREKVTERALDNVDVHTYHSLATKHYAPGAYTDAALRSILLHKSIPETPLPLYDVVVLDEVQDCTLLYHRFVIHAISGLFPHKIQMVFLGDRAQRIYEFKGADERFLTRASDLWQNAPFLKSTEFAHCELHTSYRLSNQMAAFVNTAMLGEPRIDTCRHDLNVVYMRGKGYQLADSVVQQIKMLIMHGFSPGDVFLVCGSVRGPLAGRMENKLVDAGIPCHIATGEARDVDERVIAGKAAFVTCHGCKGRQRKFVFVLGFDNSYFSWYGRNLPRDVCPNTLYVAATRATRRLFLLEKFDKPTDRFLEFLKMSHRDMQAAPFMVFQGAVQTGIEKEKPEDPEKTMVRHTSPTKLIQFVSDTAMEVLEPMLARMFVQESGIGEALDLPGFISTKMGLHEDVSDINGVAIPAIYQEHLRLISGGGNEVKVPIEIRDDDEDGSEEIDDDEDGSEEIDDDEDGSEEIDDDKFAAWEATAHASLMAAQAAVYPGLLGTISEKIGKLYPSQHPFLRREFVSLPRPLATPEDYLRAANLYLAIQDQLYFRVKQISRDEYTWLTSEVVHRCLARFDECVGSELGSEMPGPEFEDAFIDVGQDFEHAGIDAVLARAWPGAPAKFRFSARADLVTGTSLWELKCTSALSVEHFLQTIIYAWLWRLVPHAAETDSVKEIRLFNVMTGERWRLEASTEDLTEVMVCLLRDKYASLAVADDEAFVAAGRAYL